MGSGAMRRFGAGLIVLGLWAALFVPVALAQQQEETTNLALNRPFSCTAPNDAGWSGLVDGVKTSDQKPCCFATDGSDKFPKVVTIDLGEVCQIGQIDVLNSLNGNTCTVGLACSADGKKWTELRTYVFPDQQLQKLTHRFPPAQARYVRITMQDTYGGGFGGDNFIFLREVEVCGKRKAGGSTQPAQPPNGGDVTAPRELRIFSRYALRSGARLKLAVLGDRVALGPDDAQPGMGELLADLVAERYAGVEADVLQFSKEDMTAEKAVTVMADVVAADPDLCLVALGATDSLDWQDAAFRKAISDLLVGLQRDTRAALILVSPPSFAADPDRPLAEETAGKTTAKAVAALRGIGAMTGIPVVDAEAAFANAAIDRPLLYEDNVRPSELGQTVIARKLLELLK